MSVLVFNVTDKWANPWWSLYTLYDHDVEKFISIFGYTYVKNQTRSDLSGYYLNEADQKDIFQKKKLPKVYYCDKSVSELGYSFFTSKIRGVEENGYIIEKRLQPKQDLLQVILNIKHEFVFYPFDYTISNLGYVVRNGKVGYGYYRDKQPTPGCPKDIFEECYKVDKNILDSGYIYKQLYKLDKIDSGYFIELSLANNEYDLIKQLYDTEFVPCKALSVSIPGMVFKKGKHGIGYYKDDIIKKYKTPISFGQIDQLTYKADIQGYVKNNVFDIDKALISLFDKLSVIYKDGLGKQELINDLNNTININLDDICKAEKNNTVLKKRVEELQNENSKLINENNNLKSKHSEELQKQEEINTILKNKVKEQKTIIDSFNLEILGLNESMKAQQNQIEDKDKLILKFQNELIEVKAKLPNVPIANLIDL